ncbi:uncharacterized protein LOC113681428 [Pocillopora damicornis]|uniref:uncharacterized protein LOC113681428 n=1 Tax=Pocillopora damicornis TaxID=46731 RepID=UPI000F557B65|nr:uncharacterized protein LOC113681428 [Pocillopora damicornis]
MAQRGKVVFVIFLSCYLSEILSYASGASPCEDHHPRCGHWASKGECKKNVKWMSKHCRSTCGLCAQANVHDLYKQAKLEIHGAFFLFFGIVGIVPAYECTIELENKQKGRDSIHFPENFHRQKALHVILLTKEP